MGIASTIPRPSRLLPSAPVTLEDCGVATCTEPRAGPLLCPSVHLAARLARSAGGRSQPPRTAVTLQFCTGCRPRYPCRVRWLWLQVSAWDGGKALRCLWSGALSQVRHRCWLGMHGRRRSGRETSGRRHGCVHSTIGLCGEPRSGQWSCTHSGQPELIADPCTSAGRGRTHPVCH